MLAVALWKKIKIYFLSYALRSLSIYTESILNMKFLEKATPTLISASDQQVNTGVPS